MNDPRLVHRAKRGPAASVAAQTLVNELVISPKPADVPFAKRQYLVLASRVAIVLRALAQPLCAGASQLPGAFHSRSNMRTVNRKGEGAEGPGLDSKRKFTVHSWLAISPTHCRMLHVPWPRSGLFLQVSAAKRGREHT